MVARAQAGGLKLTGTGGLLQQLTKRVLESALEGELTDHLGHERGQRAEGGRENYRNGHRAKTVVTEAGPVEITVPRDRADTFEPVLVKKRQRRLGGIDEMVLSLSAKGLTHGEISAHQAEVYGAEVSKSTIRQRDRGGDGMAEPSAGNRPVYPVVFIDCVHVKVRDGQVANRPVYMALAVTAEGTRDILGLWVGDCDEGAKYWLQVLTDGPGDGSPPSNPSTSPSKAASPQHSSNNQPTSYTTRAVQTPPTESLSGQCVGSSISLCLLKIAQGSKGTAVTARSERGEKHKWPDPTLSRGAAPIWTSCETLRRRRLSGPNSRHAWLLRPGVKTVRTSLVSSYGPWARRSRPPAAGATS